MILKLNKHFNGFLIKYQAIKGFFECDQEIKVKFCRPKILIPVADGSTVLMRVTTPRLYSRIIDHFKCLITTTHNSFFIRVTLQILMPLDLLYKQWNLSITVKLAGPKLSVIQKFYCIL